MLDLPHVLQGGYGAWKAAGLPVRFSGIDYESTPREALRDRAENAQLTAKAVVLSLRYRKLWPCCAKKGSEAGLLTPLAKHDMLCCILLRNAASVSSANAHASSSNLIKLASEPAPATTPCICKPATSPVSHGSPVQRSCQHLLWGPGCHWGRRLSEGLARHAADCGLVGPAAHHWQLGTQD